MGLYVCIGSHDQPSHEAGTPCPRTIRTMKDHAKVCGEGSPGELTLTLLPRYLSLGHATSPFDECSVQ